MLKEKDVLQIISETKTHYSSFHGTLDAYLRQFKSVHPQSVLDKIPEGRSRLFIPKTYSVIKRKVASFYDSYLSGDGVIEIDGTGEKVDILNAAVNYYENAKPFRSELISIFYDFYIYGIGIAKLTWRDGVVVSRIDPRDFAFDLNAKKLSECRLFVHSFNTSKSVLDSFGVKNPNPKGFGNKYFAPYLVDELYYVENKTFFVASVHNGKIFSHRKVGIFPFAFGFTVPKAYDPSAVLNVYGDSDCRILEPLQTELNEIRNQMRDATRKDIDPVVLSNHGSGLDPIEWYNASPGEVIDVTNFEHIHFAPRPSLIQANNEIKNNDLEIQEALGVTSYNSGISRAGMLNQTATGMSILTSEGNNKIAAEIRTAHETFFKPFAETFVKMVYLYAPTDVISKAYGKPISGFDRNGFDYAVSISIEKPGENTELKKQRLVEAAQYTQNDPVFLEAIKKELLPMLVNSKTIKEVESANNQEQGGENGVQ